MNKFSSHSCCKIKAIFPITPNYNDFLRNDSVMQWYIVPCHLPIHTINLLKWLRFVAKVIWQYFRSGGLHGYQNKEDCNLNQSKLYSFVGGLTKNNSEKIENATKLQTISGLIVLFLPQLCLANSLQSGDNSRYSYSNREKAATTWNWFFCPMVCKETLLTCQ